MSRCLPRSSRWLALPLLAGLLAGCGGSFDTGYTDDFVYPLRKDPLVLAPLPAAEPLRPIPPGQLEESIRHLPEIKGKLLDPEKLPEADREALRKALEDAFGKPAQPTVKIVGKILDDDAPEITEIPGFLKTLNLDDATLAEGGKLFRRHCMHCHGVAGDGRGPSGLWLSPTPRDFRQGVFKFISCKPTLNRLRPRREDIRRTLKTGIEGTSMPSFALLPEPDLDQLVSYIIHLSLRGEVEFDTLKTLLVDPAQGHDALVGKKIEAHVASRLASFLGQWSAATGESGATPTEAATATDPEDEKAFHESVRKGYAIFTGSDAGCIACHQDFGRQARFRYDDWGTVVRPNNLTAGVYRGGRRPIDIYYRLRCGIPGANMPRLDSKNFPDEKLWALVNFVRALPYPDQLPADIYTKVYGPAGKP